MVGRRVELLPLPQLPRYLPICFGLWQSYARLWDGACHWWQAAIRRKFRFFAD
jgi:hypothetical protein